MEDVETRTVLSLRTGTKICVLVGIGFIVLAVYLFLVPITSVRTNTGAVFGCGTALSPSHGGFAGGVCGRLADVNRYRAIAAAVLALLSIIGGGLLFGVDRREEQRKVRRDWDEDSADDRHNDSERDDETRRGESRRDRDSVRGGRESRRRDDSRDDQDSWGSGRSRRSSRDRDEGDLADRDDRGGRTATEDDTDRRPLRRDRWDDR